MPEAVLPAVAVPVPQVDVLRRGSGAGAQRVRSAGRQPRREEEDADSRVEDEASGVLFMASPHR